MITLLFLVLLANILEIWLRRRYQEEAWKQLRHAFAGLVLTASGFLAVLSLFWVFDSIERQEAFLQSEMTVFYGALLIFGLSLVRSISTFLTR